MKTRLVEVADVLAARDARAALQRDFLRAYAMPVICLTMNIAGPVKIDDAIYFAFREGVRRVEAACGGAVRAKREKSAFTGYEAVWAVNLPAAKLKARMCEIEQVDALGRLFDLDVIDLSGEKRTRGEENCRRCLLCDRPAFFCARSRAHAVPELFERAHAIIRCFAVGRAAQRALLAEAECMPKPGLVDPEDAGAHADMDIHAFRASAQALTPYFEQCAWLGANRRGAQPAEVFASLKEMGITAELTMRSVTNGANTHKGAIFSLGLLSCAAGMSSKEGRTRGEILRCASELAKESLRALKELHPEEAKTGGERQFFAYGYTGARGQAAAGFPDAVQIALPVLENSGKNLNDAGIEALMRLMAEVLDSNLLRRGGREGLEYVRRTARECVASGCDPEALYTMNADFKRRNLSPGGSADLLAVAYFLHFLSNLYEGG